MADETKRAEVETTEEKPLTTKTTKVERTEEPVGKDPEAAKASDR